jgi:hypothetical protein
MLFMEFEEPLDHIAVGARDEFSTYLIASPKRSESRMRQRLRGLGVEEAMRRCYRSFGKRGFYSFSQILGVIKMKRENVA